MGSVSAAAGCAWAGAAGLAFRNCPALCVENKLTAKIPAMNAAKALADMQTSRTTAEFLLEGKFWVADLPLSSKK
jgi:hypothetical protein